MTPKLLVHGRLQHGVGHSARIRQAAAGVLHQHDEGVRVRIVEQKAREPGVRRAVAHLGGAGLGAEG